MIVIEGKPVPKGRPRMSRVTGRAHTPPATKAFEDLVRVHAKASRERFATDPVIVIVSSFEPIPKSWGQKKAIAAELGEVLHTSRPDFDNLIKSAVDGIQTIVFEDDSQIVAGVGLKAYGLNPRTEVETYAVTVDDGKFFASGEDREFEGKSLRQLLGKILLEEADCGDDD